MDRERVAEYRLTITVKDNPENIRNARRVIMDTEGAASGARGRVVGQGAPAMARKQGRAFPTAVSPSKNIWGAQGGGCNLPTSRE